MEDSDLSEIYLNETSDESSDNDENETVESSFESIKTPIILDGTFFKIINQEKSGGNKKVDNVLAQCMICKHNFKGTVAATSNFLSHLKKKHVGDYKKYEEYKKKTYIPPTKKHKLFDTKLKFLPDKSSAPLQQLFKRTNQNVACKAIAQYIVEANCPLRTVELPAFKALIKTVSTMGTEVSCPTRVTITNTIATSMNDMKNKIALEIKTNNFFCTTADMWSAHRKSYIGMSNVKSIKSTVTNLFKYFFLGVTIHFLNANLERKSYAIACKRFKGEHNYLTCGEMIQSIHQEYGLHNKNVTVTVTDNGSNLKKSFREFGMVVSLVDNRSKDSDDSSDDDETHEVEFVNVTEFFEEIQEKESDIELPFHHCCASHTLSLIATTDVGNYCKTDKEFSKMYHPTLAKCFGIWNLLKRSSSKANEAAVDIVGKNLRTPCPTRWNSLYDSIIDLLKIDQIKINDLCVKLKLPVIVEKQFQFLKEYVDTIAPIAITLDKLQGDLQIGMGELTPCLLNAVFKLEKIVSLSASKYCLKLAKTLIHSIKKRFDYVFFETVKSNHYILATASHPRWKLQWCHPSQKERITQVFLNELKTNNFSAYTVNSSQDLKSNEDNEFYEFLNFNEGKTRNESPNIERFLMDFLADTETDLCMLKRHPAIKEIFLKYNAGIPSSAPVERLFSFGSLVLTPRRCLLGDNNFENCLLLRANAQKI